MLVLSKCLGCGIIIVTLLVLRLQEQSQSTIKWGFARKTSWFRATQGTSPSSVAGASTQHIPVLR